MPRQFILAVSAIAACTSIQRSDLPGCYEPELDLWCTQGVGDVSCDPPPLTEEATPCGDLMVEWSGPNLSGVDHVFRDGEHITARFWTDTNRYCGGFISTYGESIDLRDCR